MKGSDLFIRCLEQEGVKTIYGVPGEENADIMISLLESPIEFVICRHEQGAAFMADVEGRLTGRPGVCLATLGPGATNLVTGVANANFDRAPVVAITGQASTGRLHKESHQNMDADSLFRPVTKWNTSLRSAENIPEVVRKAFKIAAQEKPGATHIELPENLASHETNKQPLPLTMPLRRPAPDHKAAARALELLAQAEAPIVLAGNGCIRKRASKQLGRFVQKTGVYVVTTFMGKGALPATNNRCLYTAGLASRDHVTEAFEAADLVICLGYDMIEWPPDRWNVGRAKRVIHIDFEEAEVDENYQPEVEVVADLAASLWAINEEVDERHQKTNDAFATLRGRVTEDLHQHDNDSSSPIKPQRILSELRTLMRPQDLLISDVGAHKMWVARQFQVYEPGTCIISNGFCSMGIALPGAIAAKRLRPELNVVGLMGDGGFFMNIQELATAVQFQVPATFVVWDDGGYGLIGWKQEAHFGKTSHTRLKNPDIAQLAESFGCRGIRVTEPQGLRPAFEQAFAETSRPTVVVIPVDYSENMKLTRRLGELLSH